jgi:hypothetical protein
VWQTFINEEYFRICVLVKCKILKRTAGKRVTGLTFPTNLTEGTHSCKFQFAPHLTSLCVYHLYLHVGYLHFRVAEGFFTMASFEIATKANLASVLPGLLVALHSSRSKLPSSQPCPKAFMMTLLSPAKRQSI